MGTDNRIIRVLANNDKVKVFNSNSRILIIKMEYWSMMPYIRVVSADQLPIEDHGPDYMYFEIDISVINPEFFRGQQFIDIVDKQTDI